MKIVFTKHAEDKLKTKGSKRFCITKRKIKTALLTEFTRRHDVSVSVFRVISPLDTKHSLCIIGKSVGRDITVITFFPAQKGRYENKILS